MGRVDRWDRNHKGYEGLLLASPDKLLRGWAPARVLPVFLMVTWAAALLYEFTHDSEPCTVKILKCAVCVR